MNDLSIRQTQHNLQPVRDETEAQRITQHETGRATLGVASSHHPDNSIPKTGSNVKGVTSMNASDFVEAYFVMGKIANAIPIQDSQAAATELENSRIAIATESNVQVVKNVHNLDILRSQLLK